MEQGPTWGKGLSYPEPARSTVWVVESRVEEQNKEPRPRAGGSPGSSMTAPEEANRARASLRGQRFDLRTRPPVHPPAPPSPSTAQPARLTAPSPALRRSVGRWSWEPGSRAKNNRGAAWLPEGACRFPWSHCDPSCHRQPLLTFCASDPPASPFARAPGLAPGARCHTPSFESGCSCPTSSRFSEHTFPSSQDLSPAPRCSWE